MSGGGTQNSFRKALGALKDSTTVSLAKVNSNYKELDIAIVKATNHVERPAKERHVRAIFSAISATRPRADVAYCINALSKRLSKTHNWAVASKTLILIHQALREVDPTFVEELINFGKSRSYMLNMAHFKDNSSEKAWDYSSWVRTYAFFLEERLECFRVLGYDVEIERIRTGELETAELLVQLPMLQQMLYRILGCEPHGAAENNHVIRLAMAMVVSESAKIYQAINCGINNLVDKFFEMPRNDAVKALDVYSKACRQGELLSEFYEACKRLDIGRRDHFAKIEQPHPSFMQTMEDYVKDAPLSQMPPNQILAIEYIKKETPRQPEPEPEPVPEPEPEHVKEQEPKKIEEIVVQVPDLVNMNEPSPAASDMLEKNAMALAIVPVETDRTSAPTEASAGGWELALVAAPSSNTNPTSTSKLAGGLDLLTLDSLYEEGIRRNSQPVGFNQWEPPPYDPFAASHGVAPPPAMQMANQQQSFMLHQQQRMMLQHPVNPYAHNFGTSTPQYPNPYYSHM